MARRKRRSKVTRLEKYKKVAHKHLIIENDEYIDVIFGVVFANRLDSKPVWLHIVGVPGSGKTEILQSLSGTDEIYQLSSLTSNTLISGMVTKAQEKDPSLIPKLDGKVLVIKDFTVILTSRSETRSEIVGQLRDAYDGTCRKTFGTGKDKFYRAKFGVLTAVTNEIDDHLQALSALGERFLLYRLPRLTESESRARADKASRGRSTRQQEEELNQAALLVLMGKGYVAKLPDERRKEIEDVCVLVAAARTEIKRERQSRSPQRVPQPEVPTRLMKQLCDLAVGIATVRQRRTVGKREVDLVSRVGLDSIPIDRLDVLRVLASAHPNDMTTKSIASVLRMKDSWPRTRLDDLCMLGIVETKSPAFGAPAKWKLTTKHAELLQQIKSLDTRPWYQGEVTTSQRSKKSRRRKRKKVRRV